MVDNLTKEISLCQALLRRQGVELHSIQHSHCPLSNLCQIGEDFFPSRENSLGIAVVGDTKEMTVRLRSEHPLTSCLTDLHILDHTNVTSVITDGRRVWPWRHLPQLLLGQRLDHGHEVIPHGLEFLVNERDK